MENNFSLIYPSLTTSKNYTVVFCDDIIKQLGMDWMMYNPCVNWNDFLTDDIDTIQYREEVFADIMDIPQLTELCRTCVEQLKIINELRKIRDKNDNNESRLYAIKEIEIYIEFIENLFKSLDGIHTKIKSRAMISLYKHISTTYQSDEYIALRDGVSKLSFYVKSIKSLTVGINLDAELQPYESGIVAINDEYFHSGDLISRFMRMEVKKDEMTTLAPLSVTSKSFNIREQESLGMVINNALVKIVGAGFREWKDMIVKYFHMKTTPYANLLSEFEFLVGGAQIIEFLKSLKLPICCPRTSPKKEKRFEAKGLYNPIIAEKIRAKDEKVQIVLNDFSFDNSGMLYVLTGPNRGGKSVVLGAVGIAQLMFQLGLPVAAQSLDISPVDCIYTHLPTNIGDMVGKGRFGEECARLKSILRKVSPYSMVLLDETLSGTDAFEASVIAEEVLKGLAVLGCRGIFVTHLHELSNKVIEINSTKGVVSQLDNLVSGMDCGKRSYKINRCQPDGKSYAHDIAEKYGLSLEKILLENQKPL